MGKYNLNEKSFYKLFGQYDKTVVDVCLMTLHGTMYERTLKEKYGNAYDGVGAPFKLLSYMEQMRLESALLIVDERLKGIYALILQGKSIEEVKKLLHKKSETEMLSIFRSATASKPKEEPLFTTLNQILRKYNTTVKRLSDAMDFVPSSEARLVYKKRYGIECKILSQEEILQGFDLSEKKYKEILLSVQKELPELLKKVPKENTSRIKVVAKEAVIPEEKVKETCEYATRFQDNFKAIENLTEQELEEAIIHQKRRSPATYSLLEELYGNELKGDFSQQRILTVKKRKIDYFISGIAKYIVKSRAKAALEAEKQRKREEQRRKQEEQCRKQEEQRCKQEEQQSKYALRFQDNFKDIENLTEQELEEAIIHQKRRSPAAYRLLEGLYGPDLKEEFSKLHITYPERQQVNSFIRSTSKYIIKSRAKDALEAEKQRKREEQNQFPYKDFFWENVVFTIPMSEFKKQEVLNYQKMRSPKAYELLKKLYGEELKDTVHQQKLTPDEKKIIDAFFSSLASNAVKMYNQGDEPNRMIFVNPRKSFYEYFYKDEMTDAQKEEIRRKVKFFLDRKYRQKKVQYLKEIYGENYDQLQSSSKDYKITYLSSLVKAVDDFLNSSEAAKLFSPEILEDNFLTYFYTEDMDENEKKKTDQSVLKYMNDYAHLKSVQIVKNLYGSSFTALDKNREITDEEKNMVFTVRKNVKIFLKCLEKSVPFRRFRRENFFEYFYEENMSDEEKKAVHDRIIEFLRENSNDERVLLVKTLYGENYDTLNKEITLSHKESKKVTMLIIHIKKMMERNNQMILATKTGKQRPQTYFHYFYTENMDEETKVLVKNFVLSYLEEKQIDTTVIKKIYSENFETLNPNISFSLNEKNDFWKLLRQIRTQVKKYLKEKGIAVQYSQPERKNQKGSTTKKGGRKRRQTYFHYFYTDDMDEATKMLVKNFVLSYFKGKEFAKTIIIKVYGEDFETLNPAISLSPKENNIFKNLLPKIRKDLHKYLEQEKISKEQENVKEIDLTGYSYIQIILIRLYQIYQDIEVAYRKSGLSLDDFISCGIDVLEMIDVEEFINFVLRNAPNRLKDVLGSTYFYEFGNTLTIEEQQVIYLKLLAKIDNTITDEAISLLTNIPVEEIREYTLMTPFDSVNQLNQYMKK